MKRLWIALGVIALDQGSKFLAVRYLAPSGPVTLIPGVLGLRYAENTGMAFSMFAGRSWLLGLCSLGLLVLAWLFLRRLFTPGFLNGTVVLAAGVMVWVALAQLLPGALHPAHRTAGILGAAVGCLLMLLGIAALP